MNNLEEILIDLLEEMVIEDMPENWKNSKFLNQRKIQIDKRGSKEEI